MEDRVQKRAAEIAESRQREAEKQWGVAERTNAAASELTDVIIEVLSRQTAYSVEILHIVSEPTTYSMLEASLLVSYHKEMLGNVVHKQLLEIYVTFAGAGEETPFFVASIADGVWRPSELTGKDALTLHEAADFVVEIVVEALATSVAAGCDILDPDEGAERVHSGR